MAKNRSRQRDRSRTATRAIALPQRDPARITRRSRLLRYSATYTTLKSLNNKSSWVYPYPLTQIEDRRLFNPTLVLARSTTGNRARLTSGRPTTRQKLPYWIGFKNPSKVVTCVRRKVRKEVIHALQIRGGSGRIKRNKTSRRTFTSEIRC